MSGSAPQDSHDAEDAARVSIAALRSKFESLSSKPSEAGPSKIKRPTEVSSRTSSSASLNGLRGTRATEESSALATDPARSVTSQTSGPSAVAPAAPSPLGSSARSPPPRPRPKPQIAIKPPDLASPASPTTASTSTSSASVTSPTDTQSPISESSCPVTDSAPSQRTRKPPPLPPSRNRSYTDSHVVSLNGNGGTGSATPPVSVQDPEGRRTGQDRGPSSKAAVAYRTSPRLPLSANVETRQFSASSKQPLPVGDVPEATNPGVTLTPPSIETDKIPPLSARRSPPPPPRSRASSPGRPPEPDRASKHIRRSPSPMPEDPTADSAIPLDKPSITVTPTQTTKASLEAGPNPPTPPRLPSRPRSSTLSRQENNMTSPLPKLLGRTNTIPTAPNHPHPAHTGSLPIPDPLASKTPTTLLRQRGVSEPPPEPYQPPPPPTRNINPNTPPPPRQVSNPTRDISSDEGDEESPTPLASIASSAKRAQEEYPDSTHANRRAPSFIPDVHLRHPHHIHSFAIFGRFVCTGAHHVRVYDTHMSERPIFVVDLKDTGLEIRIKDPRVTAMCFMPGLETADEGRYLLCGTKDGHLWCLDILTGEVTDSKSWIHGAAVMNIFRHKKWVVTLDESGKLLVCLVGGKDTPNDGSKIPTLIRSARVADKTTFARLINGQLWTASPPAVRSSTALANSKGPTIRVYEPCVEGTMPPAKTLFTTEWTGAVTSATSMPFRPDEVFLGHEGGFISIWSASDLTCKQVIKISSTDILALEGVGERLWAGNRKGHIHVYDIAELPWETTNIWAAHEDSPVYNLIYDPWSIEHSGRFAVFSTTLNAVRAWDGLLSVDWIDKQMLLRQPDYCTFRDVKMLVCTWNINSAKPQDLGATQANATFLSEVLGSVESPDIVVFGFQEVVPLGDTRTTAKNLLFGGKHRENGQTADKVSSAYRLWLDKLNSSVLLASPGKAYIKLQSESLLGLFTCMFVKAEHKDALRAMEICTVKRGMGGMYGNKGAIIARMIMDDTSLCFINVHLAAGQSQKAARNADLGAIMEEKAFFPSSTSDENAFVHGGDGTAILDHEMVILNGDLNYRIDQRRENVLSNCVGNDFDALLGYDQLNKEMKNNRAFRLRSFQEAPITFAPTYKYDTGSTEYDSSEKRRIPAWCDRILFTKSPHIQSLSYRRYEPTVSDHRPVSAGFNVTLKTIDPDKMRLVRGEVGKEWGMRESEMLEKMSQVFSKTW